MDIYIVNEQTESNLILVENYSFYCYSRKKWAICYIGGEIFQISAISLPKEKFANLIIVQKNSIFAESVLSETINGKRPISIHVAAALEKVLGIPVELWMNLQNQYNIDMANITSREKRKETVRVTIPVADRNLLRELAHKFGWACML